MSRRWGLALLMAMLAGILAACGGGTGGGAAATSAPSNTGGGAAATSAPSNAGGAAATSAPSGGGSASAGACSDAGKGQQITMWSPLTGPDGDEMTGLANKFSQENSLGIKVTHTAQPDYLQKLNTAAAGNSLPDMTVIRAGDIGEMVARNVLKPMSDAALTEAGGADALQSQFTEAVWNAGQVKDKRYTIPLDTHPLVLYYNKDMFQKAGITVPTDRPMTKEEFEKAVDALNKDGVAGVALGTAFQTGAWFQALIRQFGGDITDATGSKATFNSDAGVQAATYIHDLKAKTTPQVNGAGDPEVKLFQQQKAAMVFHGPWHISDMVKLPFVGFAEMPQIGSTYSVWGNSHQLAMTTEDPAKQAAAGCWVGWLSQNSVQWAKAGQVPARKSARESADLASVSPPVAAFAKEVEAVKFLPPVPGLEGALWGQGFEPALNAYLLGQSQDIKQGLNDAAAKSDKIIQDNAAKYK
ncbi:ABC transporter substrate-binding protein [Kouleothrix sp.]|uniref:ABC transporter substrate-binding protein n=1 Tax=Kouleothrix sp. TaxID=2779161 RepID=UPI0039197350